MAMDSITIFTDGGCSGNPGPGGWAYRILAAGGVSIEGSGGEPATTNNRMELRAVIEALRKCSATFPGARITLYTDSQYVKNGITSWIVSWKRNGWRTADKKPVKNKELWELLDAEATALTPRFEWVKGHAGQEHNERCDELVRMETKRVAV